MPRAPPLPAGNRWSMREAKRLHAHIITAGLQQQVLPFRRLFTLLLLLQPPSSSALTYANLIFHRLQCPPAAFLHNTMIRAHAPSDPLRSLSLYRSMRRRGTPVPDRYTFPFLLKACHSHLPTGQHVHCDALKHGFAADVFVQNSLLRLYGSASGSGIAVANRVYDEMEYRDVATWTTMVSLYVDFRSVEAARQVFDEMPERSAVSYSAMIAGYVGKNRFKEALALFSETVSAKVEPNDATFTSVLCACAHLGNLGMGRWVHSYISRLYRRRGRGGFQIQFDSRITTGLIDMYFKCGAMRDALGVFTGAMAKGVGEWTALISGLSLHGLGRDLIMAFEEMVSSGVRPNAVTFVALLTGCTHAGLVKEGMSYFYGMEKEFGIYPTIEHFGCVVDLLGRAGLIDEAMCFIQGMPIEANAAIWGALLNACRVHKNLEVGEIAAKWLMRDEPWNGAIYMTLLSLYIDAGRWVGVEKVKAEMSNVGCRKSPGCSLLELDGTCLEFVAGDKSHPLALEVCTNMSKLVAEFQKMDENDSVIPNPFHLAIN